MFKGIFAFLIFTALACSSAMAAEDKIPLPSNGFQPKAIYDATFDQAWVAVVTALNVNGIPIANSSKENLQISTDYAGSIQQYKAGGLLGRDFVRYKFNIFFAPQGSDKVKILVKPVVELSNGDGGFNNKKISTPFHDVTTQNTKVTDALRDWLLEQTEKNF